MKTKTIALLEMAIVLCSMLLMALPAIAAANEKTYKHTDLDVFGNANGDDIIDMRDTTYIKLAIFGKKPETELADANNDGKVSMLDVGQTKLIILGKEKKLTFIDIFGEAVTVNKPINRLVNMGFYCVDVTRILGAKDILVAVGYDRSERPIFYPEISKLPVVGSSDPNIDYEYILSLKPDAVATNLEARWAVAGAGLEKKRIFEEKLPGLPLICLNMREPDVLPENVRTYGYIIDREDEAEKFIDWFEGYYNMFRARTDGLSEDERQSIYLEFHGHRYKTKGSGDRYVQAFIIAGGRNIADDIVGPDDPQYSSSFTVDPEWVVEQNPNFIFVEGLSWKYPGAYDTDDPSTYVAARRELLDRPELANVNAVKYGHVYVLDAELFGGAGETVIGAAYSAKLFHPDLFADIDPQAIHQEFVEFHGLDFNVKEHGVFVYPPYEEWPV